MKLKSYGMFFYCFVLLNIRKVIAEMFLWYFEKACLKWYLYTLIFIASSCYYLDIHLYIKFRGPPDDVSPSSILNFTPESK